MHEDHEQRTVVKLTLQRGLLQQFLEDLPRKGPVRFRVLHASVTPDVATLELEAMTESGAGPRFAFEPEA